MEAVSLMLFGYVCGSVPFGKVISWRYGIDIQRRGSGNIGFANVQRVLGWPAGLLTLGADILKGALPVLLARLAVNRSLAFWVGVCAILGHIFPLWLHFRGGKGIATGLGLVIILQPLAAAAGAVAYILIRWRLHNSGRSSLLGIVVVLAVGCLLAPADWWRYLLLLGIALYTLRLNILNKVPQYDT